MKFTNVSQILNNPDKLNFSKKYILTSRNEIVIYDQMLAQNILKSKEFIQFNLIENLYLISQNKVSISSISDYFKNSPLLLDGLPHLKSRMEYAKYYSRVENQIKNSLQNLSDTFFMSITDKQNSLFFIDAYVELIFRQIIAFELDCNPQEIPTIPQSNAVFKFIPSPYELRKFNRELENLYQFILSKISKKDTWSLISIVVMGESIRTVLLYSMFHFKKIYIDDISLLFDEVSAISIIPRKALNSVKFDDLEIEANQSVFISPFLIKYCNEKKGNIAQKVSLAFGLGTHSCPGKSLAKMICLSFLNSYVKYNQVFSINLNDACFYRDFSLRIK